ncbi:hypothetical protein GCM10011490_13390 [Pseudoclavibacter endophyticus]|uniref:Uncharacterized protein n=1 Tax=Pseudoclavibacter endophyticus TaxID=1778590 RepID=A0A6H9WQK7_9MICO|nr:hypothetical protein [Pseudoclavibacter endophyticus]KAB1649257.1 hypothetical protein F8O04_02985 [Pseudoclavibacter endophyticus]GGA64055.1 hypothetical protein GCM10011490_13390 [Pseudoclavibacter endophyticus]
MTFILGITIGPAVVGMAIAFAVWFLRRRTSIWLEDAAAGFSVAAALTCLLGALALRLIDVMPLFGVSVAPVVQLWEPYDRFTIPLVLTLAALVFAIFPVRRGGSIAGMSGSAPGAAASGSAGPSPFRRVFADASTRAVAAPLVVLVIVVAITIAAGAASDPETGFTQFTVSVGDDMSIGAPIYGWRSSLPALAVIALVLATAFTALITMSRPSPGHDYLAEARVRRRRTGNISLLVTGGLLAHLAMVLFSLSRTASLGGSFTTPEGLVSARADFAELAPALQWIALGVDAAAFACWASVALTAVPGSSSTTTSTRNSYS